MGEISCSANHRDTNSFFHRTESIHIREATCQVTSLFYVLAHARFEIWLKNTYFLFKHPAKCMYFITHLEQGVVFFLSFSRNFSPIFKGHNLG